MKKKDGIDLEGERLEKQPRVCGMDFGFCEWCDRRAPSVRWVSAAQELNHVYITFWHCTGVGQII